MAGYDNDGDFTRVANDVTGNEPFGGAKGVLVKFYKGVVKDEALSAQEGRPRHKRADMVSIIVPGDRDNIIDREVFPLDIQRFPKAWERFQAGQEQDDGTPLSSWPMIDAAMVEDLRYYKITTIEGLANLGDVQLQKIGPLTDMRNKARQFLAAAKDNSVLTKLDHEKKELESKLAAQDEMIKRLNAKVDELSRRR